MEFEQQDDQELYDSILESVQIHEQEIDSLTEAGVRVKRTKAQIRKAGINRTAILLAKAAGDPIYDKYAAATMKMREFRAVLLKKYGSKAKAAFGKKKR